VRPGAIGAVFLPPYFASTQQSRRSEFPRAPTLSIPIPAAALKD